MPLHESLTTCDTEDFAKTSQFLFSSYSQRYVRLRVQVASFEAQMKVELLEHQFYMKYEKLKDDQTKKVMHQNNCNNILRRENDIQLSYKRSRLGAYITRLSASGSVDSSFQTDGNCILGEEDTSLVDDLQSNEILVQQVSVCRKVVASKIPNLCNLIIEILRLYITDLEEPAGVRKTSMSGQNWLFRLPLKNIQEEKSSSIHFLKCLFAKFTFFGTLDDECRSAIQAKHAMYKNMFCLNENMQWVEKYASIWRAKCTSSFLDYVQRANKDDLLRLTKSHWGIENRFNRHHERLKNADHALLLTLKKNETELNDAREWETTEVEKDTVIKLKEQEQRIQFLLREVECGAFRNYSSTKLKSEMLLSKHYHILRMRIISDYNKSAHNLSVKCKCLVDGLNGFYRRVQQNFRKALAYHGNMNGMFYQKRIQRELLRSLIAEAFKVCQTLRIVDATNKLRERQKYEIVETAMGLNKIGQKLISIGKLCVTASRRNFVEGIQIKLFVFASSRRKIQFEEEWINRLHGCIEPIGEKWSRWIKQRKNTRSKLYFSKPLSPRPPSKKSCVSHTLRNFQKNFLSLREKLECDIFKPRISARRRCTDLCKTFQLPTTKSESLQNSIKPMKSNSNVNQVSLGYSAVQMKAKYKKHVRQLKNEQSHLHYFVKRLSWYQCKLFTANNNLSENVHRQEKDYIHSAEGVSFVNELVRRWFVIEPLYSYGHPSLGVWTTDTKTRFLFACIKRIALILHFTKNHYVFLRDYSAKRSTANLMMLNKTMNERHFSKLRKAKRYYILSARKERACKRLKPMIFSVQMLYNEVKYKTKLLSVEFNFCLAFIKHVNLVRSTMWSMYRLLKLKSLCRTSREIESTKMDRMLAYCELKKQFKVSSFSWSKQNRFSSTSDTQDACRPWYLQECKLATPRKPLGADKLKCEHFVYIPRANDPKLWIPAKYPVGYVGFSRFRLPEVNENSPNTGQLRLDLILTCAHKVHLRSILKNLPLRQSWANCSFLSYGGIHVIKHYINSAVVLYVNYSKWLDSGGFSLGRYRFARSKTFRHTILLTMQLIYTFLVKYFDKNIEALYALKLFLLSTSSMKLVKNWAQRGRCGVRWTRTDLAVSYSLSLQSVPLSTFTNTCHCWIQNKCVVNSRRKDFFQTSVVSYFCYTFSWITNSLVSNSNEAQFDLERWYKKCAKTVRIEQYVCMKRRRDARSSLLKLYKASQLARVANNKEIIGKFESICEYLERLYRQVVLRKHWSAKFYVVSSMTGLHALSVDPHGLLYTRVCLRNEIYSTIFEQKKNVSKLLSLLKLHGVCTDESRRQGLLSESSIKNLLYFDGVIDSKNSALYFIGFFMNKYHAMLIAWVGETQQLLVGSKLKSMFEIRNRQIDNYLFKLRYFKNRNDVISRIRVNFADRVNTKYRTSFCKRNARETFRLFRNINQREYCREFDNHALRRKALFRTQSLSMRVMRTRKKIKNRRSRIREVERKWKENGSVVRMIRQINVLANVLYCIVPRIFLQCYLTSLARALNCVLCSSRVFVIGERNMIKSVLILVRGGPKYYYSFGSQKLVSRSSSLRMLMGHQCLNRFALISSKIWFFDSLESKLSNLQASCSLTNKILTIALGNTKLKRKILFEHAKTAICCILFNINLRELASLLTKRAQILNNYKNIKIAMFIHLKRAMVKLKFKKREIITRITNQSKKQARIQNLRLYLIHNLSQCAQFFYSPCHRLFAHHTFAACAARGAIFKTELKTRNTQYKTLVKRNCACFVLRKLASLSVQLRQHWHVKVAHLRGVSLLSSIDKKTNERTIRLRKRSLTKLKRMCTQIQTGYMVNTARKLLAVVAFAKNLMFFVAKSYQLNSFRSCKEVGEVQILGPHSKRDRSITRYKKISLTCMKICKISLLRNKLKLRFVSNMKSTCERFAGLQVFHQLPEHNNTLNVSTRTKMDRMKDGESQTMVRLPKRFDNLTEEYERPNVGTAQQKMFFKYKFVIRQKYESSHERKEQMRVQMKRRRQLLSAAIVDQANVSLNSTTYRNHVTTYWH